jgi:hypothetical protein
VGIVDPWARMRHRLHQIAGVLRLPDDVYRLRLAAGAGALHAARQRYDVVTSINDAEVSVFSQWGEDGILDLLCESLGLTRPRCLEIGVGDYREANTRLLVELRGSPAVVVDADPHLRQRLLKQEIAWRGTVVPVQALVTRDNVAELCLREELGGPPDIVSLDIDGMDYWVLEALPLTGCSVVVAEYNGLLGHVRAVSVPYMPDFDRYIAHYSGVYYGASLGAFVHLLGQRGFTFVGATSSRVNAFFVRNEFTARLPFRPPPTDNLHLFTERNVRDARDRRGALTFGDLASQRRAISNLPVIDVSEHVTVPVSAGFAE